MIHLPKAVLSTAIALLLAWLLVVAVLLTALRLTLPYADQFRPQIEEALTHAFGREVRIGAIHAALSGFTPIVSVERLVLPRRDGEPFEPRIERVLIVLDPLASLQAGAARVTEVELIGADLQVRRTPAGGVKLTGLEDFKPMDPAAGVFFLSEGRLRVKAGRLQLLSEGSVPPIGPIDLTALDLSLSNARDIHRLGLSAVAFRYPTALDAINAEGPEPDAAPLLTLSLSAQLGGPPQDPARWEGPVYLRLESRDPASWLSGFLPSEWTAGQGAVSLDAWAALSNKTLSRAVGQIRVQDLDVSYANPEVAPAALHLEKMKGIWRWRSAGPGHGGRLDVADLRLCLEGMRWPVTDLSLGYAPRESGLDLTLDIEQIGIAALTPVIERFAPQLPEALWTITEQQPHGRLHKLGVRLSQRDRQPPRWSVGTQLRGVGIEPLDRLPGFDGLDARLRFDAAGGRVELSSSALTLQLPRLFRGPLSLDALTGRLHWQHRDDGLWLISEGLCLSNTDLKTQTRFRLQLPADGTSPYLNLSSRLWDGNGGNIAPYLPVGILKPRLRGWLERALIDGHFPAGEVRFLGRFADYPFDGEQGHFEVRFDVEDGGLSYRPGWPRLEAIQGRVRFLNRQMRADLVSGRLLDTVLSDVTVEIPDLFPARVLKIDGRGAGPFNDGRRILSETPLRSKLGRLASAFEVEGPSRLQLRLDVPLRKPGERKPAIDLRGALTWPAGAALSIKGSPIALLDLGGELVFTRNSISADLIRARLWDAPVRLQLKTEKAADGRRTRIGAEGVTDAGELGRRFPSPLWGKVKGSLPWKLDMHIRDSDILSEPKLPIAFRLSSDLRGIALDLPAPFGKTPSQRQALDLSGTLVLGSRLSAQCRLGGQDADLLFGYDSGGRAMRLKEIRMARLQLGPFALRDLLIEGRSAADGWFAQVKTRDLEGTWKIPGETDKDPIRVHLYDLDLDGVLSSGETERAQKSKPRAAADPLQAPLLDLRVDRLRWGANDVGSLTVRSRRESNGIVFDPLSLDSDLVKVRGRAEWLSGPAGPRTSLRLDLEAGDMGAFLRRLDVQGLLDSAPSKARLELAWPGGPEGFSVERIAGDLEIDIGAGTFIDVEPGVGRMLGILNVGALQRRLRLDFRDVLEEGYAFEQIDGRLRVDRGQAEFEGFKIKGSSADIEVEGRTDLVARRFDQTVLVTPKLGAGVALASAVAGGPLLGAAVFVVDKVTGGTVDKLSRFSYRVTGPWSDPLIEPGSWDPGSSFIKSGGRAQSRKTAPEARREDENLLFGE